MKFAELINRVRNFSDDNAHNYALLEIAKYYKLEEIVKIIKHIIVIHDINKSMPYHLIQYRYELKKQIFKYIPISEMPLLENELEL